MHAPLGGGVGASRQHPRGIFARRRSSPCQAVGLCGCQGAMAPVRPRDAQSVAQYAGTFRRAHALETRNPVTRCTNALRRPHASGTHDPTTSRLASAPTPCGQARRGFLASSARMVPRRVNPKVPSGRADKRRSADSRQHPGAFRAHESPPRVTSIPCVAQRASRA